jgi:hypothetical protein
MCLKLCLVLVVAAASTITVAMAADDAMKFGVNYQVVECVPNTQAGATRCASSTEASVDDLTTTVRLKPVTVGQETYTQGSWTHVMPSDNSVGDYTAHIRVTKTANQQLPYELAFCLVEGNEKPKPCQAETVVVFDLPKLPVASPIISSVSFKAPSRLIGDKLYTPVLTLENR